MGKNLKGKECGKGICQRKDGLYFARYVDSLGKWHDKYFHTLSDARNWLKQAKEATAPQNDLCTGEVIGLTWDAIDWEKRTLTVNKTLEFRHKDQQWRAGEPAKNSSYDTHLYKLCDEAGIKRFCMHTLRHTYATRAIESGVQPKVLQKLVGHASIKTTMDRYVHVTDESMTNAVQQFEKLFA